MPSGYAEKFKEDVDNFWHSDETIVFLKEVDKG